MKTEKHQFNRHIFHIVMVKILSPILGVFQKKSF